MNIVDVIIVLFVLFGGVVGLKKGFTRQLVDTVGIIAVVVISFLFKGYVSHFLYKFMPFFNFTNRFAGITTMNILLYEIISFVLLFTVLFTILAILKKTTTFFEKLLNATFILGIPSKILGFVIGAINNFVISFIVLFVLTLPVLGVTLVTESNLANKILNSTPLLSNVCNDTVKVFNAMSELVEQYKINPNRAELNQETLLLLIDCDIIDKGTANELIKKGKLTNAEIIK